MDFSVKTSQRPMGPFGDSFGLMSVGLLSLDLPPIGLMSVGKKSLVLMPVGLMYLGLVSLGLLLIGLKSLGHRWKKKTYKRASNACVNFFLARVKSVPNFTVFCRSKECCNCALLLSFFWHFMDAYGALW